MGEDKKNNTADESTSLLADESTRSGYSESSSTGVSYDGTAEEFSVVAGSPWPSTFEHSIALLGGPTTDVDFIDQITRSPRIIPIQAQTARNRLKKLRRGYHTPDPEIGKEGVRFTGAESPEPAHFSKKMSKTKSLDFPMQGVAFNKNKTVDVQNEQRLKLAKASAYRQKILQSTASTKQTSKSSKTHDEYDHMHSPGYGRELAANKQKKEQAKVGQLKRETTFFQCVFNLANSLMGVGLLGLPFLFEESGWIGGTFVIFSFSLVTWRTSILIGRELNGDPRPNHNFFDSPYLSPHAPGSSEKARMFKPIYSFPDIARAAFGEWGAVVLGVVLYFEIFSCLCIFIVAVGDHLYTLFPQVEETTLFKITAVILVIPTALIRTPTLLSYLSAVGTVTTMIVVLSVLASGISEGDITEKVAARYDAVESAKPYHIFWNTSGLPLSFGLVAYCFSGHAVVPSVYCSMKKPQEYERMVHYTYFVVTGSCLVIAISGYYMFGSMVRDQVTLSLELDSYNPPWTMTGLTWLMIFTGISKFVLSLFVLSLGMEEIAAPYIHTESTMMVVSSIIKLVFIGLALIVSIYCPNFGLLCSLVGLTCTSIVSVIFPAAAHLKLFGSKLSLSDKILDHFFIIFGVLIAVVGTATTVGSGVAG